MADLQNNHRPTFAVVIPVYNGRAYLAETIRSVLAQTLAADEIIVVEDGSPLGSADIVEQFPEVRYILQSNTGVSRARNHGASLASSEWICFLDQDVILLRSHLHQFNEALKQLPDADLLYTSRRVLIQRRGEWVTEATACEAPSPKQLADTLLDHCPFPPSGVCVRRSVFSSMGGFDSRYDLAEDWEFWLRCLFDNRVFVRCPNATVSYRVHPESNSHRPIPILNANLRVIQERIAPRLSGRKATWHRRRLVSRQEAEAAILLRQLGQEGALTMLLHSMRRFPAGDFRRYKIATHMFVKRLPKLWRKQFILTA